MNRTAKPQDEAYHLFDHGDTTGAIVRILPNSLRSLNELLPEDLQQTPDVSLPFAYTCCYLNHQKQ